jgi:hypothetical protein
MWNRGVTRWFRCGLSVAGPFVCRCLTSLGPGMSRGKAGRNLAGITRLGQNVDKQRATEVSRVSRGMFNADPSYS